MLGKRFEGLKGEWRGRAEHRNNLSDEDWGRIYDELVRRHLLDVEPDHDENQLEDLDLEYILTDKEEDNLRSMNNISETDLCIDEIKLKIKQERETRGMLVKSLEGKRDELLSQIEAFNEPGKKH